MGRRGGLAAVVLACVFAEELVTEVIDESYSTPVYSTSDDARDAAHAEQRAERREPQPKKAKASEKSFGGGQQRLGKRPSLSTGRSAETAKEEQVPPKKNGSTSRVPATLDELHAIIEEGLEQQQQQRVDPREIQRRTAYMASLGRSERRRYERAIDSVVTSKSTYYDMLRVGRRASVTAIKKAYRKLALTIHPDRNPSPRAMDAFDALTDALHTLIEPAKRRDYDRRLKRKALVRRTRFKRQFKALVEDTVALVDYRRRDKPNLFYGALILVCALLLP
mmetsp:Transcript_16880/g.52751  ORF Transcript_16880/g.52751 Transcript_16880/m.52751 type:complete len:279 (-) Transcript_16880:433-1269(-)